MLVRLEDHELPTGFLADVLSLGLIALRARHPIPACQRIAVVLPCALFVGPTVREEDRVALVDAAREVGAAVRRVSPYMAQSDLRAWLVDRVFERGERRVTSTLPPARRRDVAG